MVAAIDSDKCTGCGNCADVCPVDAIEIVDGKAIVDEDNCVDCGACKDECPNDAVSMD